MLEKITLKRYACFSIAVIVIAYIYQLTRHQDCIWDGCVPADGYTFIGSIFGLPAFMLWPLSFIGLILGVAKFVSRKQ